MHNIYVISVYTAGSVSSGSSFLSIGESLHYCRYGKWEGESKYEQWFGYLNQFAVHDLKNLSYSLRATKPHCWFHDNKVSAATKYFACPVSFVVAGFNCTPQINPAHVAHGQCLKSTSV